MSDKDHQRIMDLLNEELRKPVTKEEALESLIRAGILDKNGKYTKHYPNLAAWQKKNKKLIMKKTSPKIKP